MSVQVGLSDLHYAILKKDDKTGVEYDKPVRIAGAINAKISPKSSTETLYADDGPAETATALGETELELEVKDLPLEVQVALLGHKLEKGVMISNSSDTAPYVAIGFRSLKSKGGYRYVWLLKGSFELPENDYKTKEDKPSFQTPKIKGTFVVREFDGDWRYTGDEDEPTFEAASTWFEKVYEKTPTV